MALAKLSGKIVSMRGRSGGKYYKKDTAGQHIQAMPRNVWRDYPTIGVTEVPGFSRFTRGLLTLGFTAACIAFQELQATALGIPWVIFAVLHSLIKGDKKLKLPARTWFLHANTVRMARGLPPIKDVDIWFNYGRGLDYKAWFKHIHQRDDIFSEEGTFRERPFYRHKTKPLFLWFDGELSWCISQFPGVLGSGGWKNNYILQTGVYLPYGDAEGEARLGPKKPWRGID